MQNPKFIMFLGPMWASKTVHLLAYIDRFTYQKKNVIIFKPKMDDRYSISEIVSHNGAKITAMNVTSGSDIIEHVASLPTTCDVIAVDEAFMIDGASDALIQLFRLGKTIIVSSLDMSAACNPFDEITKMMPWATHIEKCTAVCSICQCDAAYTHRKNESQDEIQVGGTDLYEPRCWSCHSYVCQLDEQKEL